MPSVNTLSSGTANMEVFVVYDMMKQFVKVLPVKLSLVLNVTLSHVDIIRYMDTASFLLACINMESVSCSRN